VLGIKNPVIDQLIEELVAAPTRESLIAHTHALDRVLQYGYYVIPQFHNSAFWVAYWNKFKHPEVSPKYGLGISSWWVDPGAEQTIETKKNEAARSENGK
jgi:microcin C transport system substrate-binding protein